MIDNRPIHVLTTGGTIDKVYFDALSEYRIGASVIARLLDIAHRRCERAPPARPPAAAPD